MLTEIDRLLVRGQITIAAALDRLNETAVGLLLVTSENGELLRTVTDGDLRRLILEVNDLTTTLLHLSPRRPVTCHDGLGRREVGSILDTHSIDHLPVVDASGKPIGLHTRRSLAERIYLSKPHLGSKEQEYVQEAFDSNWIAPVGPNIGKFEAELGAVVDGMYVAAVSSGTAAIHLALRLLDVGEGDIVFASTFTFVATVNPVFYQGAQVVFIDSEPESWCMSPSALRNAFEAAESAGQRVAAVIVVNLYGQSASYAEICEVCGEFDTPLVEDAAESLGATYRSQPSGTFGEFGIFSFNGNKIITTSGGGALLSRDSKLVERARHLATQAREVARHYEHTEVGYNYRMSNVLAGIGRGQLSVIDQRVQSRREIFERYVLGLKDVDALVWMPEPSDRMSTRWLTAATITSDYPSHILRDLFVSFEAENIEARPVWKPLHLQPVFKGAAYFTHDNKASVSDELFKRGLCLPSSSNMTVDQQEHVISVVRSFFGRRDQSSAARLDAAYSAGASTT